MRRHGAGRVGQPHPAIGVQPPGSRGATLLRSIDPDCSASRRACHAGERFRSSTRTPVRRFPQAPERRRAAWPDAVFGVAIFRTPRSLRALAGCGNLGFSILDIAGLSTRSGPASSLDLLALTGRGEGIGVGGGKDLRRRSRCSAAWITAMAAQALSGGRPNPVCHVRSLPRRNARLRPSVFHFRGRGCLRVNARRASQYTSWFHDSALEMRLPTIGTCEAGRISSSAERSEARIERPGLCC